MDKKIITLRASLSDKQTRLGELEAVLNVEEGAANYRSLTDAEVSEVEKLSVDCKNLRTQIGVLENVEAELIANRSVLGTQVIAAGEPVNQDFGKSQKRDISQFSLVRGLRTLGNDKPLTGAELEFSQEAEKEERAAGIMRGDDTTRGNEMKLPSWMVTSSRAMTVTGQTSAAGDQGGLTVQSVFGGHIKPLDQQLVLRKAGAVFMSGLTSDVFMTRGTNSFRPAFLAENATAPTRQLNVEKIALKPKRLAGSVPVSRQLLIQSSVDIEAMVANAIIGGTAIAIDDAGINSVASSTTPTGLFSTAGIIPVVGGTNGLAISRDHLVKLSNAPGKANYFSDNFSFITNYAIKEKLMTTKTDAGSGLFLLDDKGQILSYNTYYSGIIPSDLDKGTSTDVCSAIAFGDFSQMAIGQWAGISILVNPYTYQKDDIIELNVSTFVDVVVTQPKAFAVMLDALVA